MCISFIWNATLTSWTIKTFIYLYARVKLPHFYQKVLRQILVIPIGNYCASFFADLFSFNLKNLSIDEVVLSVLETTRV